MLMFRLLSLALTSAFGFAEPHIWVSGYVKGSEAAV